MSEERTNLYFPDVIVGVMSALALRGICALPFPNYIIDETFREIYPQMKKMAESYNLEVHFRIFPRGFYKDSETVQKGIYHLIQSYLVTLDSPRHEILRIIISKTGAEHYLDNLPGPRTMYIQFADIFLKELDHQKTLPQ